MKKLLGSTLALALLLPASANAELLKNLKFGGNLDVQTTSADNVTDFVTRGVGNHDHLGHANSRAILKMDWDLLDDVHSRVTLVKGAAAVAAAGQARSYGQPVENLQTVQTNTLLQEANVKIDKLFGAGDLTLGRQFYGEAGDLVIYFGPRDNYGMTVDALDAARFDWNGENVSVTGVAGKISNTDITTHGGGAVDLRGLVIACNKNENVKGSFYVYNKLTHAAGDVGAGNVLDNGKNDNLYVIGLKTKLTFGGLMASAEFDKNMGEDRTPTLNQNYKGFALLAKAAYKADLQDVGAFTPWGEFGYGTGDEANNTRNSINGNRVFQSINTDYRPGGIYGRFATGAAVELAGGFAGASNGLSNRIIWGVGFKATPAALNKLTAGVQFYKYAFHTRVDDATNEGGTIKQATSRSIGSEYDLTAEWKHSENVSVKGTLGSFQTGEYMAQLSSAHNPATMAALDFSIKF